MNPVLPILATLTADLAPVPFAFTTPGLVGLFVGITLVVVPPLLGLLYLGYFLFSLPLRRQERARLFLDVIEVGIERGESPERTILGAAAQRDRKLGKPFRELAARIEEGLRFGEALELTPGLLPPQAAAMLKAGLELGDLRKVLPGCRRLLRDGAIQVSHAHHYLMLLAFATSPMWIAGFWLLCVFVLPRFQQITADMGGEPSGLMWDLIVWRVPLLTSQFLLVAVLWLGALIYCGGPRFTNWLARHAPFSWDRLATHVPWRRNRLQRDFSSVLAAALDAGLPESRAVMLAGEGTGNECFRAQAVAAVQDLRKGVALPEALARMDEAGEFRWRLANAVFGGGGFSAALNGWQEALDAKAFQQEQTAAQLASTSLVILNGVLVGLLAVGVFQMLVNLLWSAALW